MTDHQTIRVPILTVLEPYATCIIHGPKRVENRTWKPPAGLIGKKLAIHAGKNRSYLQRAEVMAEIQCLWPTMPSSFPSLGCVIGFVCLTRCWSGCDYLEAHPLSALSQWAHGPWCWQLDCPQPIQSIAMRGQPGIFYHDFSRKEASCLF